VRNAPKVPRVQITTALRAARSRRPISRDLISLARKAIS
jgi:hypothetical protein